MYKINVVVQNISEGKRFNMKRYLFLMGSICLTALLTMATFYVLHNVEKNSSLEKELLDLSKVNVEKINSENSIYVSTLGDIKVSPNATLIIKKKYLGCGHISKKYSEVNKDIVNMTEDEVKEYYSKSSFEVIGFSSNEIVLFKECEGYCNEHFVLRNVNGKVSIYLVDEDGMETIYEKTEIQTKYLEQQDIDELNNGIFVIGMEELNSRIEDYE